MKKCRLPKKLNNTSIELDCTLLAGILKRVDSVTKFSESTDIMTHIHLLVAYQSDVFIVGRTPDTFVAHHVPGAKAEKDTAFNIDPNQLVGIINKRGPCVLSYDGAEVEIKAVKGKYKARFKVRSFSPEQVPMVQEGLRHHVEGGQTLNKEFITKLADGVRLTRLRDPYTNAAVICRVETDGKTIQITSPGTFTSAQYKSKLTAKCPKFRFSLSGEMFDLIYKFIASDDIEIHADTTSFTAESADFVVSLPPLQSNDEDYRFLDTLLEALGDSVYGTTIKGDLSAPFENIQSIVDKKGQANATIKIAKKEMKISFANDSGSVQDSVKLSKEVKKPLTCKMDMKILKDMLKHIGREPKHDIAFKGSSINDLKAFTLTYNQDDHKLLYLGYIPS